MSNNQSEASPSEFYGKLDEKLDDAHESMKEYMKTLPTIREEIADLDAKTCALLDPHLTFQLENIVDKSNNMRAKSDANLQLLQKQNEVADRYLAELKAKRVNTK